LAFQIDTRAAIPRRSSDLFSNVGGPFDARCAGRAELHHETLGESVLNSEELMRTLKNVLPLMAFFLACMPAMARVASDEAAIHAIATNWERAWNRHDMKLLAGLMTDDADFVNVGARHWKGRQEIEAEHAKRLAQFQESTWSTKAVKLQFLKPDVALVHVNWALEGDKEPDGTPRPPRNGVFTWIVIKQGEGWLIRAAQNTNQGNLAPHPAKPK
jgi:uncharacterized protein (TIGR02246 family)